MYVCKCFLVERSGFLPIVLIYMQLDMAFYGMSVAGTTLYPGCGRGQCLLRIVAASVYDVNQRFVLQACNICCCFIDMTDIISMYCAVNLFHDQCCCFSRWFACRCDVFECFWFGIINWSQGCRWRKHVWLLLGTSSQVNTGSCPDIVWDVDPLTSDENIPQW